MRHVDEIFLHVPGAGRTALGTETAVQAHILVLDHDPSGLEIVGDVEVLARIVGWRLETAAQIGLTRRQRNQCLAVATGIGETEPARAGVR